MTVLRWDFLASVTAAYIGATCLWIGLSPVFLLDDGLPPNGTSTVTDLAAAELNR